LDNDEERLIKEQEKKDYIEQQRKYMEYRDQLRGVERQNEL